MVRGSHGFLRRTRNILKIKPRERGKISIRRYLQTFEIGEMVAINIDPRYKNFPYPKFNGKIGEIVKQQGRAYYIRIDDNGRKKDVLVCPEHLKKINEKKKE